jgi:phosphomethylpyrimidine synthase
VGGKIYPELRVPMREISLAEGNAPVYVYDTSGPYTDPNVQVDVRKGLPKLRESWIVKRGDVEGRPYRAKAGRNVSQMHYAKKGVITVERAKD